MIGERKNIYIYIYKIFALAHPDSAVSSRILLLLQRLPALVKFSNKRVIKIHNLKSRYIRTPVLNLGQIPIHKALIYTKTQVNI